jgi:hypothetical protein
MTLACFLSNGDAAGLPPACADTLQVVQLACAGVGRVMPVELIDTRR